MDVREFWELVEKHPEIPRILTQAWHRLGSHNVYPGIIRDLFGVMAVKEQIRAIVYKDWSELNVNDNQTLIRESVTETQGDVRGEMAGTVYYVAFWHKGSEQPFVRGLCEDLDEKRTVKSMIAEIHTLGGKLDAIVRISCLYIEASIVAAERESRKEQAKRFLVELGLPSEKAYSYEIFPAPRI